MLTREENDLLTQTGPGTPMGDLFRRHWIPACLAEEIPGADSTPARVTLLSESQSFHLNSNPFSEKDNSLVGRQLFTKKLGLERE